MGRGALMITSLRLFLLAGGLGLALACGWPAMAAEPHRPTAPAIAPGAPSAAEPELQHEPRIGENAAEHGQGPAHAEGEHTAGMPQLDTSTFASQIFWLVIAFVTLFYLFRRKALPRVAEILEARQERIAADLDRAARLREEAEAAQRQHEEVVAQAHTRALEQLKAAQERASSEIATRQAGLAADLNQRLSEAEARIGAARERALAEVQGVAVEVAQVAVERLAGLKVSEAEARDALSRVMAEAA